MSSVALSRADASAALQDIDAATTRSEALRGYQSASPHLIIWGAAWALAYIINDVAPAFAGAAWIGIALVASGGDILAARADRRSGKRGAIVGALFGILAVFVGASIAVMAPTDPRQIGAFIPLVVAACYATVGLMDAPRMLILGGCLAALTLVGFFALPAHFMLWMAVVGGGSLILGGLWLRRV